MNGDVILIIAQQQGVEFTQVDAFHAPGQRQCAFKHEPRSTTNEPAHIIGRDVRAPDTAQRVIYGVAKISVRIKQCAVQVETDNGERKCIHRWVTGLR